MASGRPAKSWKSPKVIKDRPVSGTDDEPNDIRDPFDIPNPVRRSPRITEEMRTEMAVLREAGDTTVEIADLFGVNPRTVRSALSKVSEEEKRSIARYQMMVLGSEHYRFALDAIRAARSRDLNETDTKGRYLMPLSQLLIAAGISTDHVNKSHEAAGMTDRAGTGTGNPIADFIMNAERSRKAIDSLPAGSRLKLNQSLEIESGPEDSSEAVEASWDDSSSK